MNCNGEPVLGTECTFACPERWTLNGSVVLTCGATGHWSGMLPTCEGEARVMLVVWGGGIREKKGSKERKLSGYNNELSGIYKPGRSERLPRLTFNGWIFHFMGKRENSSDMLMEFR